MISPTCVSTSPPEQRAGHLVRLDVPCRVLSLARLPSQTSLRGAHPKRGMTSISTSCGGTGSSERRPGSKSRPAVLPGMPARPTAAEGHLIVGYLCGWWQSAGYS